MQAVEFPFRVLLSLLVKPVPEQFESFHVLVPPLTRTGVHTVRPLPSVEVMLYFTSLVLWTSPTPCDALRIFSPFGLMDAATITQPPLGGMFMDITRSPSLEHMALITCHRHDTGETGGIILLFTAPV